MGVVVYAGGDDVLALLPPELALSVAQRLSEEFMREWDNRPGHIVLGMGCRASCSVGLLFAHYMHHLAHAMDRARNLQEGAKELDKDYLRGKGAIKAEFYGRAGPICEMSEGLHWIEPWRPNDLMGLSRSVSALLEGDNIWVGVSWLTEGCDIINVLLARDSGRGFFSPVVIADQWGGLSRGGLGDLARIRVSRRAIYELRELMERIGDVEPSLLATLARRSISRHVDQPEAMPSLSDFLSEQLEVAGRVKVVIEAAIIADHAYEFAKLVPRRFEVV